MKTTIPVLQDDDVDAMIAAFGAFEGIRATDVQRKAMLRSGSALLAKLAERGLVVVAQRAYPAALTAKERQDLDEAPVRTRTRRRCAMWLQEESSNAQRHARRAQDPITKAGHEAVALLINRMAFELADTEELPEQEL